MSSYLPQAHSQGKLPWKGASEFRFDFNRTWPSATLTTAIHIAVSKKWKKGVNTIVLVEPVAKLFPVSGFRLKQDGVK